jgi:BirA family transcriptional regulator, biotin operon repressor / biotin---[acetyl-CoA-carboxylase] ligase
MPAGRPSVSAGRPLDVAALRAALIRPGGLWREVSVVAETASTNEDLLAAARRGAPEGVVLAAEVQTAGRGRMGRSWVSLPGTALTFSVLLRPAAPAAGRGWVPLLTGVAVASALRAGAGIDARLKWPNDVLVNGAKLAGILAEQAGDAIVVGAGVNIAAGQGDLPSASATSLALQGAACTDRQVLLIGLLEQLERRYLRWIAAQRDGTGSGELRHEYLSLSATVGRHVRVSLPGGRTLTGTSCDVDHAGRLVIRSADGPVSVSAGDVVHLR